MKSWACLHNGDLDYRIYTGFKHILKNPFNTHYGFHKVMYDYSFQNARKVKHQTILCSHYSCFLLLLYYLLHL